MWLSRRERHEKKEPAEAQTGPVTLSEGELGAWLEGERRGVAVFSPGGYHWGPKVGDQILVLKAGENGEQPCAIGMAQSESLSPGEILIETGEAILRINPGGSIDLTGTFTVNGEVVGPLPPPKEEGAG